MSSAPAANQQCDEQTSAPSRAINHGHGHNQNPIEVGHQKTTSNRRHFASSSARAPIESSSSSSSSTQQLGREFLSPTQLLATVDTHNTQQPLIGRLHKTRNSTIYFSDSDDVDGAQYTNSGAGDCPTAPPRRFATASRFQQQHHRRHRQFHRTLGPLEVLHTAPSELLPAKANSQSAVAVVGAIAEESTDDDDTGGDAHRAITGPPAARLRESPGHLRYNKHTGATLRRSVSRSPIKRSKIAELAGPPRSPKRSGDGGCVAMLLTYGAETICMLALILTTLATFQNA